MSYHANSTSFKFGNKFGARPRIGRPIRTLTSNRARKKHIAVLSLIIEEMAERKLRGEAIDANQYSELINERRQELRDL
jgi:hypothetical protein